MAITLPSVSDLTGLRGRRVLLRLDLNVPLENGAIRDPYRIEKAFATLALLRDAGARTVIISHIGKGRREDTLRPVADYINRKYPLTFLPELMNKENERITRSMGDGDIVMLENLRHSDGEEKNDPEFSRHLASLGDLYINDAFSVSHRAHASVVGVAALLPHYAGLQMAEEVSRLAVAFEPEHPFLFIIGGAKISTKMPLLKKFLGIADHVFVGGAIVNNFFRVAGHEIGASLYDPDELDGLETLLGDPKLVLPTDVVVKNDAGSQPRALGEVTGEDMIVDIGTGTVTSMKEIIGRAKLVVWNGPLGFYEEGFTEGTRELLNLIAGSRAMSIIGGGDTVALIDEMGMIDRFSFVSTGGGAMLDFLANETLPGIIALQA